MEYGQVTLLFVEIIDPAWNSICCHCLCQKSYSIVEVVVIDVVKMVGACNRTFEIEFVCRIGNDFRSGYETTDSWLVSSGGLVYRYEIAGYFFNSYY